MAVTTTLAQHRITMEHALEILKSMTGEVDYWVAGRSTKYGGEREYLGISPVTNMENVEMQFYTKEVAQYNFQEAEGHPTQEQMNDLVAQFKKSRKWKLSTHEQ